MRGTAPCPGSRGSTGRRQDLTAQDYRRATGRCDPFMVLLSEPVSEPDAPHVRKHTMAVLVGTVVGNDAAAQPRWCRSTLARNRADADRPADHAGPSPRRWD